MFASAAESEANVDREIRIERMKRELQELSGGSMISGDFGEVPPELEELFLTRVCEIEKASWDTYVNRLAEQGVAMTPPAELDDASLHEKLWEVLRVLARISCYVVHTDHLSDRELYAWLWTTGLREEAPNASQLGGAWHTSPIGSGDDQDMGYLSEVLRQ